MVYELLRGSEGLGVAGGDGPSVARGNTRRSSCCHYCRGTRSGRGDHGQTTGFGSGDRRGRRLRLLLVVLALVMMVVVVVVTCDKGAPSHAFT